MRPLKIGLSPTRQGVEAADKRARRASLPPKARSQVLCNRRGILTPVSEMEGSALEECVQGCDGNLAQVSRMMQAS